MIQPKLRRFSTGCGLLPTEQVRRPTVFFLPKWIKQNALAGLNYRTYHLLPIASNDDCLNVLKEVNFHKERQPTMAEILERVDANSDVIFKLSPALVTLVNDFTVPRHLLHVRYLAPIKAVRDCFRDQWQELNYKWFSTNCGSSNIQFVPRFQLRPVVKGEKGNNSQSKKGKQVNVVKPEKSAKIGKAKVVDFEPEPPRGYTYEDIRKFPTMEMIRMKKKIELKELGQKKKVLEKQKSAPQKLELALLETKFDEAEKEFKKMDSEDFYIDFVYEKSYIRNEKFHFKFPVSPTLEDKLFSFVEKPSCFEEVFGSDHVHQNLSVFINPLLPPFEGLIQLITNQTVEQLRSTEQITIHPTQIISLVGMLQTAHLNGRELDEESTEDTGNDGATGGDTSSRGETRGQQNVTPAAPPTHEAVVAEIIGEEDGENPDPEIPKAADLVREISFATYRRHPETPAQAPDRIETPLKKVVQLPDGSYAELVICPLMNPPSPQVSPFTSTPRPSRNRQANLTPQMSNLQISTLETEKLYFKIEKLVDKFRGKPGENFFTWFTAFETQMDLHQVQLRDRTNQFFRLLRDSALVAMKTHVEDHIMDNHKTYTWNQIPYTELRPMIFYQLGKRSMETVLELSKTVMLKQDAMNVDTFVQDMRLKLVTSCPGIPKEAIDAITLARVNPSIQNRFISTDRHLPFQERLRMAEAANKPVAPLKKLEPKKDEVKKQTTPAPVPSTSKMSVPKDKVEKKPKEDKPKSESPAKVVKIKSIIVPKRGLIKKKPTKKKNVITNYFPKKEEVEILDLPDKSDEVLFVGAASFSENKTAGQN